MAHAIRIMDASTQHEQPQGPQESGIELNCVFCFGLQEQKTGVAGLWRQDISYSILARNHDVNTPPASFLAFHVKKVVKCVEHDEPNAGSSDGCSIQVFDKSQCVSIAICVAHVRFSWLSFDEKY